MKKIALIGSYYPRKCGIATFTYDLYNALQKEENDCQVIALNDGNEYDYPPEVKWEIKQQNLEDYLKAAKYLNQSGVELVCIQHEFGIFGGKDGQYLLELIKRLKLPVVTTFHTILDTPTSNAWRTPPEHYEPCSRYPSFTGRLHPFVAMTNQTFSRIAYGFEFCITTKNT